MLSAINSINNIDNFLDSLVEDQPITIKIGLSATVSKPIAFTIKFNGQVIKEQTISTSSDSLNTFTLDTTKENTLELIMHSKGPNHTVVNDQGEIVEDSFIILSKLEIDSYDILADDEFINNNSIYTPGETFYKGFWKNSTVSLNIKTPFVDWYNEQTKLNTTVGGDQTLQGSGRDKMNDLVKDLNKLNQ